MPTKEIPKDVLQAMERVLAKGNDVKLSKDRSGKYHLFEEKLKKVPLRAPLP